MHRRAACARCSLIMRPGLGRKCRAGNAAERRARMSTCSRQRPGSIVDISAPWAAIARTSRREPSRRGGCAESSLRR